MIDLSKKSKAELIQELEDLRAQLAQQDGTKQTLVFEEEELLELSPDKEGEELFLVTETGKIVYTNDALAENLGYTGEEILNLSLARLDKNTPRGKWLSYVTSMKSSGKTLRFEAAHLGRDGGVWKKQVTARYLTYHGKKYVLCSAKLMSLVSTESTSSGPVEDRETTLMNLVSDGIMIVDTRGNIEDTNLNLDRIFGTPKSDIVGRSCVDPKWKITDLNGNTIKISEHPVTVALVEESPVQNQRLVMVEPDSGMRVLILNAAPLYDEKGKLTGAVASVRVEGVTELDQLEEEKKTGRLLTAHRDLTRTIVESTSVNELEKKFCEALHEYGGYELVWIGKIKPHDYRVRASTVIGEKSEFLFKIKVKYDESDFSKGPIGRAIKTRQLQVCEDTQTDPTYIPWKKQSAKLGINSFAAIPLITNNEVFGVLAVYSDEKNHFQEGELNIIQEISKMFVFGVNELRNAEITREAVTEVTQKRQLLDALLKTYHDGYCLFNAKPPFETVLYNQPYCELLDEPYRSMGIDGLFLSDYIHSHMHKGLIELLEEVADSRTAIERSGDVLFRWDGEEMKWDWSITPVISDEDVIQLFYTARPSAQQ